MQSKKINILGTEYDFKITTEKEDIKLCDIDGYCDAYKKQIVVSDDYNENDPKNIGDFDSFKAKVKRHEIIHSFLLESGLKNYASDEVLVDWIAWMSPKLLESFKEVDAI